jgi:hypothetical protein
MADGAIRQSSLNEIKHMRASGRTKATPADAPEIRLDEAFWANAQIVDTAPPRKTSVHLRVDPETFLPAWRRFCRPMPEATANPWTASRDDPPARAQPPRPARAIVRSGTRRGTLGQGMTPREFLESIIRPNVDEFHRHYGDLRRAYNVIGCVDALAAHIYTWCMIQAPAEVAGIKNDSDYRATLAGRSPSFGLLRDIAKARSMCA